MYGPHRNALSYDELVQLKRQYGVSASALLVRLNRYGIIDNQTLTYAFRTFAKGWRVEEPEPIGPVELRGQSEEPRRFQRLCYRALAEQYISPGKAMELLKLPLHRIEQSMRGPGIGGNGQTMPSVTNAGQTVSSKSFPSKWRAFALSP